MRRRLQPGGSPSACVPGSQPPPGSINPWSPGTDAALTLAQGDIAEEIAALPDVSVDAILHDPPRFGTAGAKAGAHRKTARKKRVAGHVPSEGRNRGERHGFAWGSRRLYPAVKGDAFALRFTPRS